MSTYLPVEPAVPLDPADLDRIPPADLEVCGPCNGNGDVPVAGADPADPDTDWRTCGACGGSGFAFLYWNGDAA